MNDAARLHFVSGQILEHFNEELLAKFAERVSF